MYSIAAQLSICPTIPTWEGVFAITLLGLLHVLNVAALKRMFSSTLLAFLFRCGFCEATLKFRAPSEPRVGSAGVQSFRRRVRPVPHCRLRLLRAARPSVKRPRCRAGSLRALDSSLPLRAPLFSHGAEAWLPRVTLALSLVCAAHTPLNARTMLLTRT